MFSPHFQLCNLADFERSPRDRDMVFCFFPDTPPEKATAKGGKGAQQTLYLNAKANPNEFGLGMKDAPCADPACCCIASLGAPCGFTACWARKAVLEKYEGGMTNYVCFQNYVPSCCTCHAPHTPIRTLPSPHVPCILHQSCSHSHIILFARILLTQAAWG